MQRLETSPATTLDADQISAIDRLFEAYTVDGSPGCVVSVGGPGGLLYAQGYGLADIESRSANRPSTPFHIASISKQFTCFAIALLAAEGKLSLEDEVRHHLPYVPDFGVPMRIRHLAYNMSGLRDQWALFQLANKDIRDLLRQEHITAMVGRQRALNFIPGDELFYNNTGFTLLAEIVASVSGKSLRAFAHERIFDPLGMAGTFFFDDISEVVPGRANSYYEDGGRWRRYPLNYQTVGATSLVSTAEDLAKWGRNLSTGQVGGEQVISLMTTGGITNQGRRTHYGLGLMTSPVAGRRAFHHAGGDASFRMNFAHFPEHDLTITVLSNCGASHIQLTNAVADILMPSGAGVAVPLSQATAPDLVGTYLRVRHGLVEVIADGDGLACRTRSATAPLMASSDGSYRCALFGAQELRFNKASLTIATDYFTMTYDKLDPEVWEPELASFEGRYHSDELDVSYDIALETECLVMRSLWRIAPIRLTPVTADAFLTDAGLPHSIEFARNPDGAVIELKMHGWGAYDICFAKC